MSRNRDELVPRMHEHAHSIFGEMSRLAVELGAINLGQGFPDADGPTELKDAAIAAIMDGRGNQYPPVNGLPELRRAIAAHQQRFYDLSVNPESQVVVTTGASEAIVATVLALIDDGDEVLVFEPRFDIYSAAISLARGKRVGVPLLTEDLRPNVEALRAAVTPRTRMILLNSPHNPTGLVFTHEELSVVADIAREHDLLVLSDEAYEHLWFDNTRHIPISTLPGMFDRTITIGSGGKSFSFTGWKVGWASGPTHLIAAVRTIRQHLSFVSGGPFQWAMAAGLALPDQYFREFRADLAAKRDVLCSGLTQLGFGVLQPQGTYFVTTDIRPLGFTDGVEFCRRLPEEAGVVAIPNQVFCDDPETARTLVRWAFCKQVPVLEEALRRLQAARMVSSSPSG